MKIILLSILSLMLFSSCAHRFNQSTKSNHHHTCGKNCQMYSHKGEIFNKHCALSVANGKLDVLGRDEYKIEHAGDIYNFSSKENMEEFQLHLNENIYRAKTQWSVATERR